MNDVIVIDSKEMAIDFVDNINNYVDSIVLSLSPSASIVLKQSQQNHVNLYELVEKIDCRKSVLDAMRMSHACCLELDNDLSTALCEALSLTKIPIFHPAYAYSRTWIFYYRDLMRQSLASLFDIIDVGKMILYKLKVNPNGWNSFFSISDIICEFANENHCLVEILSGKRPTGRGEWIKHFKQLRYCGGLQQASKGLMRKLKEISPHCLKELHRKVNSKHTQNALLLSGSLTDVISNAISKKGMNVIELSVYSKFQEQHLQYEVMIKNICEPILQKYENNNALTNNYILNDFKLNYSSYLSPLLSFSTFQQKHQINALVWAIPLVFNPDLNILVEYALQQNLPVHGFQHGGSYVSQIVEGHFDSDFRRCTDYYPYGFGLDEWVDAYPETDCPFYISQMGKSCLHSSPYAKPVDIAFPISIPTPELMSRQSQIINALIGRVDLEIVIKPFPGYDESLFPFTEYVVDRKHIQVISPTWKNFLISYLPKLVVFELPTTTLDEIIHLDIDIFLLKHNVIPLSRMAENALSKRVRLFDNIDDLVNAIAKYHYKNEPKLRDPEYYHRYINRPKR